MTRSHGPARRPVPVGPLDLVALAARTGDPALQSLVADGQVWSRAAQEQWGLTGVWLPDDEGRSQGLALVCPALHLPPGHPLDGFGRNPAAAQLLALSVADAGDQTARLLVQALCRHLVGQVGLIDAVGVTIGASALQPPVTQLLACGFAPADELPLLGRRRLRLELRRTVRWQDLPRAWERVRGFVPHPYRPTEPTGRDLGATRSHEHITSTTSPDPSPRPTVTTTTSPKTT